MCSFVNKCFCELSYFEVKVTLYFSEYIYNCKMNALDCLKCL
jgi:hypothetical protein